MDNDKKFRDILNHVKTGKSLQEKLSRFKDVVNSQKISVDNFLEIAQSIDFRGAIHSVNFVEQSFSYLEQANFAKEIMLKFLQKNYQEIDREQILQLFEIFDYSHFESEEDKDRKRSVAFDLKVKNIRKFVSLKKDLAIEDFCYIIFALQNQGCNSYRLRKVFAYFLYNIVEPKLQSGQKPDEFSEEIEKNIEKILEFFKDHQDKNQILRNILMHLSPDIAGEKLTTFLERKSRQSGAMPMLCIPLLDMAANPNCSKEFFVDLWSRNLPNFSRLQAGQDQQLAQIDFLEFTKVMKHFMHNTDEELDSIWFLSQILPKVNQEKFGIFCQKARIELISGFFSAPKSRFDGPKGASALLKMCSDKGVVDKQYCQETRIECIKQIMLLHKLFLEDISELISDFYDENSWQEKVEMLAQVTELFFDVDQNGDYIVDGPQKALELFDFVKGHLQYDDEMLKFLNHFKGKKISFPQSSPYSFKSFFIDWAQINLQGDLFIAILENETDEEKKNILEEVVCNRSESLSEEALSAAANRFPVLKDLVDQIIFDIAQAQNSDDDIAFDSGFSSSGQAASAASLNSVTSFVGISNEENQENKDR